LYLFIEKFRLLRELLEYVKKLPLLTLLGLQPPTLGYISLERIHPASVVSRPGKVYALSEHLILYIAGGILATITAVRFILQELTTVVILYKKLRATLRTPID
jgi:hypothetical protein